MSNTFSGLVHHIYHVEETVLNFVYLLSSPCSLLARHFTAVPSTFTGLFIPSYSRAHTVILI